MMRLIPLLLLTSLAWTAHAQNLIPNGDFEDRAPEGSKVWVQPDGPNYHWDSAGPYGEPYAGKFYNGICISNFEFSEALSVSLTEPLIAGQQYHISFYIRQFPGTQGTYQHHLAKEMQVYFTHNRPPPKPRRLYPVVRERILHISLPPDSLRMAYEYIEADYTAEGGEKFFTLGYFVTDDPGVPVVPDCESVSAKPLGIPCPGDPGYDNWQQQKRKEVKADPNNPIQSYYSSGIPAFRTRFYLDNLCMAPIQKDGTWHCDFREEIAKVPVKPRAGEVYVIKRIYFEFDSTRLLPESYPALDSLVHVLNLYPDIDIRIQGHTDSIGTDQYNLALSDGRSQAVYRYLIDQGIAVGRLSFVGYGESKPVAANGTTEGRQRNRRVEFKVLDDSP